jgi:hypothetical protein
MSNPTYRIPKQTDRDVIAALLRIRSGLIEMRSFKVRAHPTHAGGLTVDPDKPDGDGTLKAILELGGARYPNFATRRRTRWVLSGKHLPQT